MKKSQVQRNSISAVPWNLVLGIWLLGLSICSAQQSKTDSLLTLLKKDKEDTNKVNHLNNIGWELMNNNPDSATKLSNQALSLCKKLNWKKGIANTFSQLGVYSRLKGDYPMSLDYYLKAMKLDEAILNEMKDFSEKQAAKKGIAVCLGSIGIIYNKQKDYSKALEYDMKALKMSEEIGDKNRIASILGNIGNVYHSQGNYSKSLDYFLNALKTFEELKNQNAIATVFGNIGNVYSDEADNLIRNNNSFVIDSLNQKALEYYLKALKMAEDLDDKNGIARNLGNLGSFYTNIKKYKESEKYLFDALQLNREIESLNNEMDVEFFFTDLYSKTNRYQLALEHYKKAMVLKDTLFSEEKNKEITRKEMNYEFEKKEAAQKAEHEKNQAVAEADKKKQQVILWSVVSGLLIVVVFAVFIFRALRITQKQKQLIVQQKRMVEEKQNEILASIRYAKRIQDALLPTEKYIDKTLKRLMKK